jgi:hypothetical protein
MANSLRAGIFGFLVIPSWLGSLGIIVGVSVMRLNSLPDHSDATSIIAFLAIQVAVTLLAAEEGAILGDPDVTELRNLELHRNQLEMVCGELKDELSDAKARLMAVRAFNPVDLTRAYRAIVGDAFKGLLLSDRSYRRVILERKGFRESSAMLNELPLPVLSIPDDPDFVPALGTLDGWVRAQTVTIQ